MPKSSSAILQPMSFSRSRVSLIVSTKALDSVIFITLAFYGVFDITDLLIGQVLAKVALSFVLVPFLITGAVAFARWLDRDTG